jgi:hypothetical protein
VDWLEVLNAAICGGLAAGIASIFSGKSKDRRIAFTVATALLFVGLQSLSKLTILPRIRAGQADRQLRGLPFYRDIAESDPQTYEKLRVVVADSVNRGEGADVMANRIASIVTGTMPKYIGTASDESVESFIGIATLQVQELLRTPSDACYYFLFPQEKGAPSVSSYFDKKGRADMLNVLGQIVHSSIHTPQPLPDAEQAQALLVPVIGRLQKEYGNDLLLIEQKPTDTAQRRKVCDITVSLYKDIKTLPESDASVLMRYLLTEQESNQTAN